MTSVSSGNVPAKQMASSLAAISAMSVSLPMTIKSQKLDPFLNSPNSSPQSHSPLNRHRSISPFSSPPRENLRNSPQRPISFGQMDISPRNSPPTSPRSRPTSIDTSFARLNIDKLNTKPAVSSISNPRPQRRLKSILKQSQSTTEKSLPSPSKSKLQFNTTMEHICHFSKNDFPSDIKESPRSTIDDSGDIEAVSASAGWEAMHPPAAESWVVLSSNHKSIVKMALSDAVQLESTRVQGDTLIGGIIVRNYDFHKSVTLRYTIDNWKTSKDVLADFCNSIRNVSNDPYGLDRFTFTINLPEVFAGVESTDPITICYALQYSVASRTYWDNNRGQNYEITILHNSNGASSSASSQESKWWETSVPRPRLRAKRSGLKKTISSTDFDTRNVAIAKPLNSLSSNFAGNTISRIEDAFASPHLPSKGNIKVQIPQKSVLNSLEVPFGSSPGYGSSYYGSSFYGINETMLTQMSSVTGPVLGQKPIKISKLYAGDDFYMSSPPSPLARS